MCVSGGKDRSELRRRDRSGKGVAAHGWKFVGKWDEHGAGCAGNLDQALIVFGAARSSSPVLQLHLDEMSQNLLKHTPLGLRWRVKSLQLAWPLHENKMLLKPPGTYPMEDSCP